MSSDSSKCRVISTPVLFIIHTPVVHGDDSVDMENEILTFQKNSKINLKIEKPFQAGFHSGSLSIDL